MRRRARTCPSRASSLRSYRIVGHTSEVALELAASEEAGLYEAAAEGLLALYRLDPAAASERREVRLEPQPAEDLLVAWLNELIYLVGTKRWAYARARVEKDPEGGLTAELAGGPLGERRPALEIKAATFGGLAVRRASNSAWSATVILDV